MAAYDVTQIDVLEHDTASGYDSKVAKIDDTHFAVLYASGAGAGASVTLKVFTIDGAYDITQTDSIGVGTANMSIGGLSIIYLGNSKLAVHFTADTTFDPTIKTYSLDGSYQLTLVDTLAHDTNASFNSAMTVIDSTHFAVAYNPLDDGWVKTFSVDANADNITEIDALEHDAGGQISDASIVLLDSTHLVIAYNGVDNDGFIKTFSFDGSFGTLTEINSLEHDITIVFRHSLVKIDATHVFLAYRGDASDGFVKTFTIDGSYNITQTSSLEHDTADGDFPSVTLVDSTHVAVAYDSGTTDGRIKIFSFTASGGSLTEVSTLTHDTSADGAEHNALVLIDSGHLALAYAGLDADGYVKTFEIETLITLDLTESITWTDSFFASLTRLFTESSTWTDAVSAVKAAKITLTESSTWTDVFSSAILFGKLLTEPITWTDAFVKSIARSLTEGSTWTDAIAAAKIKVKGLTESSTWTDVISNVKAANLALTEAITWSDKLQIIFNGLLAGIWKRGAQPDEQGDWEKTDLPD